jgi:hypothetical protein
MVDFEPVDWSKLGNPPMWKKLWKQIAEKEKKKKENAKNDEV